MSKRKRPTKPPGSVALRAYFADQRKRFGHMKGDSMEKLAERIQTTKTTVYRICRGDITTYQMAKKIEQQTGINWSGFKIAELASACCPHCGKELSA